MVGASATTALGGKAHIKILLAAGEDVRRALLDPSDPAALAVEVREGVRLISRSRTELVVRTEDAGPIAAILEALKSSQDTAGAGGALRTLLLDWAPDVVVLSLATDALAESDVDELLGDGIELITLIKECAGSHVFLFNCSSVDPRGGTSNYHGCGDDLTLRIHQLNRTAIELSVMTGISLVDVDHLAAQYGAHQALVGPVRYSGDFEATLGTEVIRILVDYGFFEERPLVAQIGRPVSRSEASPA